MGILPHRSSPLQTEEFAAPTNANTVSPVAIPLPRRGVLQSVAAGLAIDSGPARISIDVFPGGRRLGSYTIVSGWARGPSVQAGGHGVRKSDLDMKLGEDAELICFVRNDTGATVTVTLQAVTR